MTDPAAFLMPFGKHRGKRLAEIPASYLAWVLTDAPNLWPETRAAIAAFLRPPELPLEPPPAAAAHHDDGAPIDRPAQRRARRQSEPSTGDTVSHSISSLYVALVSKIPEVERVFWRREDTRIRVWTIINQPDENVEGKIAEAELELMDVLHDHDFDFSVIFRQDKSPDQINPLGAFLVYSRK